MDLYMQIGLVFIVMTALVSLITVYNFNSNTYIKSIDDSVSQTVITNGSMLERKLKLYDNNPHISGEDVKRIIKNSDMLGIGVFVQTVKQDGLIAMYGKQLRHRNAPATTLIYYGAKNSSSPTAFEKNYVVTAFRLFRYTGSYTLNVSPVIVVESSSLSKINNPGEDMYDILNPTDTPPNVESSNTFKGGPALHTYHPNYKNQKAKESNKAYVTSGRFYTSSSILNKNLTNTDYAKINSEHSMYYIDEDKRFNSVLVEDKNGQILAIYVEEHSVKDGKNVLNTMMIDSGLIK